MQSSLFGIGDIKRLRDSGGRAKSRCNRFHWLLVIEKKVLCSRRWLGWSVLGGKRIEVKGPNRLGSDYKGNKSKRVCDFHLWSERLVLSLQFSI